jgi:hypothetical protein
VPSADDQKQWQQARGVAHKRRAAVNAKIAHEGGAGVRHERSR